MDQENTEKIWMWSGVVGAALWLIVFGTSAGNDRFWQNTNAYMPYYVSVLSDGMVRMAKYHYAVAATILAASISLPLYDFISAIKKSARVALASTAIPILCSIWSFLTIPSGLSEGMASSIIGLVLSLFTVVISALAGVLYALKIWAALASTTMLFVIALQAALRFLLPRWVEGFDDDEETLQPEHAGITICLVAATVYFLGLIPGLGSKPLMDEASPVAVWENLQPPDSTGPWTQNGDGQRYIAKRIREIETDYKTAKNEPCKVQSSSNLVASLNDYFRKIRSIEDWRPGTELSAVSKSGISFAKRALENEMVDWHKLAPAVRIHLNAEKFKSVNHRFPDRCAAEL